MKNLLETALDRKDKIRDLPHYWAAKEAAKKLFALTNGTDDVTMALAVADALAEEHRTLQQKSVKAIIRPALECLVWSKEHRSFDARNEAACEFAEKALAATDDVYLPLI